MVDFAEVITEKGQLINYILKYKFEAIIQVLKQE